MISGCRFLVFLVRESHRQNFLSVLMVFSADLTDVHFRQKLKLPLYSLFRLFMFARMI